jgi:arsenate reductase
MNDVTIWHNTRCSKSRATLALLEQHDLDPHIVDYLTDTPGEDELRRVLDMLGCGPRDLMRTKEALYQELGLADVHEDAALIRAMVAHPSLIERPIVIRGDRAVIGRPPENVLSLLE